MQDFVYANPDMKIGDIVALAGTLGIEVVVTEINPPFTATREDEDVFALERGEQYQRIVSRPLTTEEAESRHFARNPREALYSMIRRRGHQVESHEGLLHISNTSNDVFSGTRNVHWDAANAQLVASSYTHIYDGDDIVKRRALALADLPAQYRAFAQSLIDAAQAASEDDDEWETL